MTAEINKAVERLKAHVRVFGEIEPRSRHVDDVCAILSELSRLREENEHLKGEADEHALFDAETDVAFKDLDATIDDLKEQVATLTRERDGYRTVAVNMSWNHKVRDSLYSTDEAYRAHQEQLVDDCLRNLFASLSRQSKEGGE